MDGGCVAYLIIGSRCAGFDCPLGVVLVLVGFELLRPSILQVPPVFRILAPPLLALRRQWHRTARIHRRLQTL